MSQLVQLEGKHSTQNAHCAVRIKLRKVIHQMRFSFVSNNAMEILPIDKRQQSSSCWPLYCSLYAPKLWNPQCERQNWNNFVLFFHHSEAEESVAFVSYLPCRPLVSLIHNTCIGVYVYVYICVCVYVYMCLRLRLHLYVPRVGIAMPRLCHPNVRPFTAASILYTPPTNIYYPT